MNAILNSVNTKEWTVVHCMTVEQADHVREAVIEVWGRDAISRENREWLQRTVDGRKLSILIGLDVRTRGYPDKSEWIPYGMKK